MRIYKVTVELWDGREQGWSDYTSFNVSTNGGGLAEAMRRAKTEIRRRFGNARVRPQEITLVATAE